MEEKIESKMTEVVEYIIGKPKETITADDYMILAAELKDARFRREQAEQGDRMAKLMAAVFPAAADVKNLVSGKTGAPARVVKK